MGSCSLSQGHLPGPGTEPGSPALQTDSLPSKLPGKPHWKKALTVRSYRMTNKKQAENGCDSSKVTPPVTVIAQPDHRGRGKLVSLLGCWLWGQRTESLKKDQAVLLEMTNCDVNNSSSLRNWALDFSLTDKNIWPLHHSPPSQTSANV